jgi:glutathione reductase (NADPH)
MGVYSCVPKKVTWNAASIAETIREATAYGFHVEHTAPFDWPLFKRKRDAYVQRLNGIYDRNLANDKVEWLHGDAAFLGPHEVEVKLSDNKGYDSRPSTSASSSKTVVIRAKHILIATGGRPSLPRHIPGYELGITSDGFFELERQPQRVAVVGAGYIAVEMSGMLRALGTDTHLFIRQDSFLRTFDPMIQDTLGREYERQGVRIYRRSAQTRVERHPDPDKARDGWLRLHYTAAKPKNDSTSNSSTNNNTTTNTTNSSSSSNDNNENGEDDGDNRVSGVLDVDCLLWAVGRRAEVEALRLERAGVQTRGDAAKGVIVADAFQNTSAPNIYAVGDVCGLVELTPVAIAAGRRLSDRLFGAARNPALAAAKLDYTNVPSVVFAHPEAGSIGMTEPEARAHYGDDAQLKVYRSSFVAMHYAMMDSPQEKAASSYKIICAGPEEKVVGLHLVGLGASEILQGFGVAIKMGATKADFDNCVAIHPTSAEELVTMK